MKLTVTKYVYVKIMWDNIENRRPLKPSAYGTYLLI
jgi:hypothetical protein